MSDKLSSIIKDWFEIGLVDVAMENSLEAQERSRVLGHKWVRMREGGRFWRQSMEEFALKGTGGIMWYLEQNVESRDRLDLFLKACETRDCVLMETIHREKLVK